MREYLEVFFGKKSSIQRKFIVVYLLVAVLPIIIITLSASIIYYNSILKGAYSLVEQNARQHEIVVQERMDSLKGVLYELLINNECIKLADSINTGDEDSFLIDGARMEILLRRSVYTYQGIRCAAFIADNGRYVTYSKWYGSMNESIWSDLEQRENIYDKINKEQKLTFNAAVNLSNTEEREDYVIMMGYPVKHLKTKEQKGVLVMALDDDVLLFDESPESQSSEKAANGITTVILNEEDRVIAGVPSSYANKKYGDYLNDEFGDIKRISENRRKIEGTDWTIVNIIDTAVYRRDIYHLVSVVFTLMITVTCFFFLIVFFASRKYIGTIQKIAQGIHDYGGIGEEKINVDMDEKDELYVIVRQFNKMTERVNSLVEMLRQRNEEVKAAAISQKHAEIKALEAQINPHFLFNTLDSINWRAIEHDEEEISDMLGTLGSLLRYSISNIDMEVVLEAEISWLKKYIFLQRDRFHDSFDCEYDITDEAMEFPIYKMLLQPIIENTILHAFEEVKEGGMIYVKAFIRPDGKLEIRIRDNGCGMEEEVVEEIKKEIEDRGPLNSKRIGISNVIHRLRIYYQEEAEISVNSKLSEGSEFIMIIPNRQKREGDRQ
ncbi:MAG: histidine kinase [Clostridiales bacterium]|nr:histidine kinase [Clostridiales bacterium]